MMDFCKININGVKYWGKFVKEVDDNQFVFSILCPSTDKYRSYDIECMTINQSQISEPENILDKITMSVRWQVYPQYRTDINHITYSDKHVCVHFENGTYGFIVPAYSSEEQDYIISSDCTAQEIDLYQHGIITESTYYECVRTKERIKAQYEEILRKYRLFVMLRIIILS